MKTLDELKGAVMVLQTRIDSVNHLIENPNIRRHVMAELNRDVTRLKSEWYDAMCEYHAHPEYTGSLCYQKENNPFRG